MRQTGTLLTLLLLCAPDACTPSSRSRATAPEATAEPSAGSKPRSESVRSGWPQPQANIGSVTLTRVSELSGPMMTAEQLYKNGSTSEVVAAADWLTPLWTDEAGKLRMTIGSVVIEDHGTVAIVDTGVGHGKDKPGESRYVRQLERAGVTLEKVDFVVITHMHSDHIGWNVISGADGPVPTFPNATYVFARAEWEHWSKSDDAGVGENIAPIVKHGQHRLVDEPWQLSPHVRIEVTGGHTPGHLVLFVEDGGATALLSGDVWHHPVQALHLDWVPVFDAAPDEASTARRSFSQRFADQNVLIVPSHLAGTVGGFLQRRGSDVIFGASYSGGAL